MDNWYIIVSIINILISGGLIPLAIKLWLDKKKLKNKKEQVQNKKIELLGDILLIYILANGTNQKVKNKCISKLEELKSIGE